MLLVALLRRIGVAKVGEELHFHEMFGILSAGFFDFPITCKINV